MSMSAVATRLTINRDCQAVQAAWRIVTVQMIYWAISRSNDWVNRSEDNGFYCGSSFWLHAVSPKSKFESIFRLDSPTSPSLNSTPFFENTFCNDACVWHIWQTSFPGIDPLNWYTFQGVRRGVRAHSVPWRIMIGKYWIALSHFHLACMYLQETCYPLVMGGKLCNLDTSKSKTYSYLELSLYIYMSIRNKEESEIIMVLYWPIGNQITLETNNVIKFWSYVIALFENNSRNEQLTTWLWLGIR